MRLNKFAAFSSASTEVQFVDFFYPVRTLFVVTHESSVWHTAL